MHGLNCSPVKNKFVKFHYIESIEQYNHSNGTNNNSVCGVCHVTYKTGGEIQEISLSK